MKKIVTLIFVSALGGMVTLGSYKLFFENDETLLVETKMIPEVTTINTNNALVDPIANAQFTYAAEKTIDAVTAVSGSGPAYVFLLAEVMAQAGIKAGLEPELAMRLARETVSGAGELMRQSDEDASTLRTNVTSPGGTTAAALAVLMAEDDGMQNIFDRAIMAAKNRSEELAK